MRKTLSLAQVDYKLPKEELMECAPLVFETASKEHPEIKDGAWTVTISFTRSTESEQGEFERIRRRNKLRTASDFNRHIENRTNSAVAQKD